MAAAMIFTLTSSAAPAATLPNARFWLQSSLRRIYPATPASDTPTLAIPAARNGRFSFQVAARNDTARRIDVACAVSADAELKVQIRRVGYVPMRHLTTDTDAGELEGVGNAPGLVPDPLFPDSKATLGPQETQAFWITVRVAEGAKPGPHDVTIHMSGSDKSAGDLVATLDVSELVIPPRRDFPVIHWWRGEATWDYYKTGMFEDERWWKLTRDQLADMLDHGSDVVYVPILFDRRETFAHPCQLLIVDEPSPGKYTFDFSLVKRFVDMCKQIGFTRFEWSHLWIYWGVENPMRIYRKQGDKYVMLWPPDTGATSDVYVNFLKQFLPAFHDFLEKEKVLDASYFHLSDEPGSGHHVENYKRARKILRDLAPWMKVMDALSDIEYGRQHLTDMPIPMVNAAQNYIDAGIPHWVYFCCAPHGPWINRFMDTPLVKIRMSGFLFYRLGAKGFLHWGFNYWDRMEREEAGDPFNDASNGAWPDIPYGDPFVVYPGKDGPIDSIRWEVFAESLQDYAILQSAGMKADDTMLTEIQTYAKFPRSEQWIDASLRKILKLPPAPAPH